MIIRMYLGNIVFTDKFVENDVLHYLQNKGFVAEAKQCLECNLQTEVIRTYLNNYYRSDLLHDLLTDIKKCPFSDLVGLVKRKKENLQWCFASSQLREHTLVFICEKMKRSLDIHTIDEMSAKVVATLKNNFIEGSTNIGRIILLLGSILNRELRGAAAIA